MRNYAKRFALMFAVVFAALTIGAAAAQAAYVAPNAEQLMLTKRADRVWWRGKVFPETGKDMLISIGQSAKGFKQLQLVTPSAPDGAPVPAENYVGIGSGVGTYQPGASDDPTISPAPTPSSAPSPSTSPSTSPSAEPSESPSAEPSESPSAAPDTTPGDSGTGSGDSGSGTTTEATSMEVRVTPSSVAMDSDVDTVFVELTGKRGGADADIPAGSLSIAKDTGTAVEVSINQYNVDIETAAQTHTLDIDITALKDAGVGTYNYILSHSNGTLKANFAIEITAAGTPSKYNIAVINDDNGDAANVPADADSYISVTVGGNKVSEAAEGATVNVAVTPPDGYTAYVSHVEKQFEGFFADYDSATGAFPMPSDNVTVVVTWGIEATSMEAEVTGIFFKEYEGFDDFDDFVEYKVFVTLTGKKDGADAYIPAGELSIEKDPDTTVDAYLDQDFYIISTPTSTHEVLIYIYDAVEGTYNYILSHSNNTLSAEVAIDITADIPSEYNIGVGHVDADGTTVESSIDDIDTDKETPIIISEKMLSSMPLGKHEFRAEFDNGSYVPFIVEIVKDAKSDPTNPDNQPGGGGSGGGGCSTGSGAISLAAIGIFMAIRRK